MSDEYHGKLVEPDNAPGDLDALENSLKAAIADGAADDPEKGAEGGDKGQKVERPDWLPQKFWVDRDLEASLEKMGKGYRELESSHGRMANDLGVQRKITDSILMAKRSDDLTTNGSDTTPQATRPKIDPGKLVEDPDAVLEEYLSAREAERERKAAERAAQSKAALDEQQFMQNHSDVREVAESEEFKQWVTASPTRSRTAAEAAAGDFSAADALLTEYKALKAEAAKAEKPNPDEQNDEDSELDAARKAATERGGAGSGGKSKGKIWRRSDLIKLRQLRPEAYEDPAFQAEITRAYAEGRVR